jgi:DNA-binding transcriptional MerR regulator
MRTPDPALERQIVTDVASYGRQLGRLLDAVDVLARQQHLDGLNAADQQALADLEDLAQKVAATKAQATAERIDRLEADIRELRRNPGKNGAALQRLKDALEGA